MDHEAFLKLLDAYQKGQASAEEKELVETHFASYLKSHPQLPEANRMQQAKKRGWQKLTQPRTFVSNYRIWAAAAILLLASIGIYLFKYYTPTADIKPGYNQATLTLADGTTVDLDSAKRGIQIRDEDISYNDGTKIGAKTIVNRNSSIVNSTMLTLSTPKGGQYQIILSDGTKVWLNAASTLKYPSRFCGDRREVFLEGEAYFEVNNNPSIDGMQDNRKSSAGARVPRVPFIVKTPKQEVHVLGTSFNLSAYPTETSEKTTLVEGKVQVRSKNLKLKTYNIQLLAPMQQAVVNGDNLTISEIDINNELAWRNNKFSWAGKTFSQIMDELARWYNIDIKYQGPIPELGFYGGAKRNQNLSFVLHILESAGITYKLEGRTLTILGKKSRGQP
ncbi:FecR family protein [bacterium A37T11]|nr:FecR family protein [bacterium A37T11]